MTQRSRNGWATFCVFSTMKNSSSPFSYTVELGATGRASSWPAFFTFWASKRALSSKSTCSQKRPTRSLLALPSKGSRRKNFVGSVDVDVARIKRLLSRDWRFLRRTFFFGVYVALFLLCLLERFTISFCFISICLRLQERMFSGVWGRRSVHFFATIEEFEGGLSCLFLRVDSHTCVNVRIIWLALFFGQILLSSALLRKKRGYRSSIVFEAIFLCVVLFLWLSAHGPCRCTFLCLNSWICVSIRTIWVPFYPVSSFFCLQKVSSRVCETPIYDIFVCVMPSCFLGNWISLADSEWLACVCWLAFLWGVSFFVERESTLLCAVSRCMHVCCPLWMTEFRMGFVLRSKYG